MLHLTAVTPLYPPGSRVGAWLATHEFLAAMADRGHYVEVVPSLSRPGSTYDLDGVHVRTLKSLHGCIRKADVVLSHLGDRGSTHRKALGLGKPSVRMIHGGNIDVRQLNGAALVVCNSEATKHLLGRWSGNVVVCPPPTDPEVFRTSPGAHVTLVNLSQAKGGDVFWKLARELPKVPFLGVQGSYGDQIFGRAPNVTVLAPTNNMRDDVYAETKLLLMPSLVESWGMVAVEAMCSGIPVLARPTPGLREVLGSAGTFVEGASVGRWSAAIQGALVPENWSRLSRLALQRVSQLDPDGSRDRFCDAVEALVDGDGGVVS